MHNRILIALAFIATTSHAGDYRLIAGFLSGDGEKDMPTYGIEVAWYSAVRKNDINYGLAVEALGAPGGAGSFVGVNVEILERVQHKYEPFITIGGLYQTYGSDMSGSGWQAGLGFRYVWCAGLEAQVKYELQSVNQKSSVSHINDKTVQNNHYTVAIGRRF